MRIRSVGFLAAVAALFPVSSSQAQVTRVPPPTSTSWSQVEQALGRRGTANPGGVLKFGFPRSDLRVYVSGVQLKPAFALGSWVAFKRGARGHTMVMGDLVLTEAEVPAVMQRLQDGGVEQTALHNHLLNESPRVMYMHISADGDEVRIARTIRNALAVTRTPLGTPPVAAAAPIDLDTLSIARELAVAGKGNGGVYQVSVPRREAVRAMGSEIPPSMGVATAISFQPTGRGRALVTGDFVLRPAEVNPVIRVLRANGITVTAIHSHMLVEEPRLFFMHFYASDDALRLARALRTALNSAGTLSGRMTPPRS